VAEGQHFLTGFFSRRPSATPDRCGRRPTFFDWFFLASAFGHAGQMWPKANIYFTYFSASPFGHAGQMFMSAFCRIGRLSTNNIFVPAFGRIGP
jgi:hypothetical protein